LKMRETIANFREIRECPLQIGHLVTL
jgi:hypothetical protein